MLPDERVQSLWRNWIAADTRSLYFSDALLAISKTSTDPDLAKVLFALDRL